MKKKLCAKIIKGHKIEISVLSGTFRTKKMQKLIWGFFQMFQNLCNVTPWLKCTVKYFNGNHQNLKI